MIRTNVLDKLDVVHIGKVKLRGIVGSPVGAALVKVNIALLNSTDDSDYISVLCAACSEANDDLVLTNNVVDSLCSKQSQAVCVDAVIQYDDDDNDDNVNDHVDDNLAMNKSNGDDNEAKQQNDENIDFTEVNNVIGSEEVFLQAKASAEKMHQEQMDDETLRGWWSLAKREKGGFFIKDNLLYDAEKLLVQSFSQLSLPKCRRSQVLELAHYSFGGHLGE